MSPIQNKLKSVQWHPCDEVDNESTISWIWGEKRHFWPYLGQNLTGQIESPDKIFSA